MLPGDGPSDTALASPSICTSTFSACWQPVGPRMGFGGSAYTSGAQAPGTTGDRARWGQHGSGCMLLVQCPACSACGRLGPLKGWWVCCCSVGCSVHSPAAFPSRTLCRQEEFCFGQQAHVSPAVA